MSKKSSQATVDSATIADNIIDLYFFIFFFLEC